MIKNSYDAIVIGGGHNGLCLAAYLIPVICRDDWIHSKPLKPFYTARRTRRNTKKTKTRVTVADR